MVAPTSCVIYKCKKEKEKHCCFNKGDFFTISYKEPIARKILCPSLLNL